MPKLSRLLFIVGLILGPVQLAAQGISSFSSLVEQDRSSFQPLSQEQAFPFSVSATSQTQLKVSWQPAPEHYLYRRAFQFSFSSQQDAVPAELEFQLPNGIAKNDEFFGDVEVYYDPISIQLTLPQPPHDGSYLVIEYQGCADWGFCYPPQKVQIPL